LTVQPPATGSQEAQAKTKIDQMATTTFRAQSVLIEFFLRRISDRKAAYAKLAVHVPPPPLGLAPWDKKGLFTRRTERMDPDEPRGRACPPPDHHPTKSEIRDSKLTVQWQF
jgi:hypothetical protein